MRDRTKQRNFDFAKYPEALEIIDNLPSHGRAGYIAKAVVNEHKRESGFTPEQEKLIDERLRKFYDRVLGLIQLHERDYHDNLKDIIRQDIKEVMK